MRTKYDILLKFLFPKFSQPIQSRFVNFFSFSNKNTINKNKVSFIISLEKIEKGEDKRTSIIIKNIPDDMTSEQFKQIVINLCPYIDFFYVPLKIRTRKKLRVAFVNVLNYSQIVPIYMGLIYKIKFVYINPDVEMEICYSKVQGKNQLIQRFFHQFQQNK